MKKEQRLNRLLAGALIGIFLLCSGGFALAAGSDGAAIQAVTDKAFQGAKGPGKGGPAAKSAVLKTVLDQLVGNNILTPEQADNLLSCLKKQDEQREARRAEMKSLTPEQRQARREEQKPPQNGFLESAVADEVITQEQAEAIQDALQAQRKQASREALQTRLGELVSQGIITQQQADAVFNELQAQSQQVQAEREKIKAMTREERQAYMKENRPQKQSPLQNLISNGTLTQQQVDQIFPSPGGKCGQGKAPGRGGKGHCPQDVSSGSNGA